MLSCSADVSVDASPLVSLTRIALTPASIWRSHSLAKAAISTAPLSSNGVGMSGM